MASQEAEGWQARFCTKPMAITLSNLYGAIAGGVSDDGQARRDHHPQSAPAGADEDDGLGLTDVRQRSFTVRLGIRM